jgi:hypothetical protein
MGFIDDIAQVTRDAIARIVHPVIGCTIDIVHGLRVVIIQIGSHDLAAARCIVDRVQFAPLGQGPRDLVDIGAIRVIVGSFRPERIAAMQSLHFADREATQLAIQRRDQRDINLRAVVDWDFDQMRRQLQLVFWGGCGHVIP